MLGVVQRKIYPVMGDPPRLVGALHQNSNVFAVDFGRIWMFGGSGTDMWEVLTCCAKIKNPLREFLIFVTVTPRFSSDW